VGGDSILSTRRTQVIPEMLVLREGGERESQFFGDALSRQWIPACAGTVLKIRRKNNAETNVDKLVNGFTRSYHKCPAGA
jgi:hypothetical protein